MTKIKQVLEHGNPGNKDIAYKFFVEEKGYSPEIAAGIVGNLMQESHTNLNTQALGFDGTGSFGVAQWLGSRKSKLKQVRPDDYNTLRGQLEFIDWELNNTEKRAARKLQKAETAEEAALIFSKHYERPHKDYAANDKRVSYANDLLKNSGSAPSTTTNTTQQPQEKKEAGPEVYQGQQSYAYNNKSANASYADITVGDDETPKAVEVKQNGLDETQVRQLLAEERSAMESKFLSAFQQQNTTQQPQEEQEYAQPQEDLYNYVDIESFEKGGSLPEEKDPIKEVSPFGGAPTSLYSNFAPQQKSVKPKTAPVAPATNPFGKVVAPSTSLDYNELLQKDDFKSKAGVEKVQQKLIDAGYDIGKTGVDGDAGAKTMAAYEEYQTKGKKTNGVNPFGEIKTGIDFESISKGGPKDDFKSKVGIEKVQQKLVNAGYNLGAYGANKDGVDGVMGERTKNAYEKYSKGEEEDQLSLEREEAAIRKAKPERGFLETASDYLTGNITEHIINPIKMKANEYLPETLDFNPNLATTRSEFDDTKGSNKYLLNNKSLGEIRQEKNISFNQISKYKGGNSTLPLNLKKRILNATYSQGYAPDMAGFAQRFSNPESLTGDTQLKKLPGKQGTNREDIFLMYTGLPQRHDTFTASSFKAGENSDTSVTFKDPEVVLSYLKTAALNTDLFDKLANGEITPESIAKSNSGKLKGGDKIHKAGFRDPQNVMWNATFGIGFDKAGEPYLSFYDNWDLKGKDDGLGNLIAGFAGSKLGQTTEDVLGNVLSPLNKTREIYGSPIEIYDRIPLTKELIAQLSRTRNRKQSNAASDGVPTSDAGLKDMDQMFEKQYKSPELQKEMQNVLFSLRKRMQK